MTSPNEPALESTLTSSVHKELRGDEFWRDIPSYAGLSAAEFQDHRFQSRNCVTSAQKLRDVLGDLVPESFYADVEEGIRHSTMSLRISPYILSLIDWRDPYADPLRIQFLPLHSRFEPDHPELTLDALAEQADSPVPGLTHRYADRALFLALDTCPVYCRFCTRSYSIGLDTDEVEKVNFGVNTERWDGAFEYIASRPELEDVIISGGDMYNLKAEHIEQIGSTLLKMENIRRLRYATKGPAIMPQKLLSDDSWVDALTRVVDQGRKMHKEVVVHTHFNHPNEITEVTRAGLNRLFERGITTRNQAVLQRGVNDSAATMRLLVRRLSYINVHPYYTFVHDMVRGVEELRTSLQTAIDLEKQVRGATAGFNTPSFVVDTMGGGGKRHVHSYEMYDRQTGIAVFTSPVLRPDQLFLYFDPLHQLSLTAREDWHDGGRRMEMIEAALATVKPLVSG
jgi:lysine 2,3-aminomutase